MSKPSKFNFGNVFTAFWVVLTGFFLFDAGIDLARHWYVSTGLDFIMAAFFAAFGVLVVMDRVRDLVREEAAEMAEAAKSKLDEIFDEATKSAIGNAINGAAPVQSHEGKMTNLLMATIDEVTGGGRPPRPDELAVIAKAFHETTGDHTADLRLVSGGLEVEVHGPTTTLSVPKSGPRNIPVKDMDEVAARRSAAGKKAAETRKARQAQAEADKIREERRAKRAAQRAAKK